MAMQKCDNCSAPLELAEIGSIQRCKYCGTENRILDPNRIPKSQASQKTGPPSGKLLFIPIFFGFILLLSGIIASLMFRMESPKNNTEQVISEQVSESLKALNNLPIPSPNKALAPSEISKLGLGWSKIDHTGMPTEFSDFDILKNFEFAKNIAQNWSTDVQIDSIYIDGVKLDGSLDLSARDDWDVDYRFYSPTHRQTAVSMAKVSEDKLKTELRIQFEAGDMNALLSERQLYLLKKDKPKDDFTPTCSAKKILEEAQKSKKFEQSPFYDLMLQYIDPRRGSKGYWRWVVGCEGCSSIVIKEGICKLK